MVVNVPLLRGLIIFIFSTEDSLEKAQSYFAYKSLTSACSTAQEFAKDENTEKMKTQGNWQQEY